MEPSTVSSRVVVGDGLEDAIAPPGSVDRHDADIMATAERHAIRCLFLFAHRRSQLASQDNRSENEITAQICAQESNVALFATVSGPSAKFALIFAPGANTDAAAARSDLGRYRSAADRPHRLEQLSFREFLRRETASGKYRHVLSGMAATGRLGPPLSRM